MLSAWVIIFLGSWVILGLFVYGVVSIVRHLVGG
jgi:hypothetical protein